MERPDALQEHIQVPMVHSCKQQRGTMLHAQGVDGIPAVHSEGGLTGDSARQERNAISHVLKPALSVEPKD